LASTVSAAPQQDVLRLRDAPAHQAGDRFHGLHVSPAGNSDDMLLNIAPQTRREYDVNIPADHPSGTFWYHSHRHGSTAIEVASGACVRV